ncbi:hypothetical protein, partial [Nitrolancea hollandica]|uniref:hypothetical protein n=1 Tax=Nitrolancea hollandica TaxID=1206749 RepID=UPI001EE65FBE
AAVRAAAQSLTLPSGRFPHHPHHAPMLEPGQPGSSRVRGGAHYSLVFPIAEVESGVTGRRFRWPLSP